MPEGPGNQPPVNPYPSEPQAPQPGGYPPPPPPAPGSYPPPAPGGYPPAAPGQYPGQQPGYTPPPPGPTSWGQPAAPPPKSNRRGAIIAIVVLVVILVGVGGCFYFFRDSLSGNVTELAVGDCFDEPAGSTTVSDVQHQPCTSPHDAEVVFVIHDPSSSYPGVEAFRTAANAQCPAAATAYIGSDFDSNPDIGGGFFYPTSDSWGSGDHDVTCYVDRTDGAKLYGTVKGLGTAPLPTAH
jgi:hypothetical protein